MRRGGRDLYFIQARVTGAVKIGRSSNVEQRLAQLQTGCPHQLRILLKVPGKGHQERGIHERLASHRIRHERGEWFSPDCLPDLPVWLYDMLDLESLEWWQER